jgi:hypothetical protein
LHDLERIRRVRSFSAEQSQALGSLEDPEGCRHRGYYIKVGKVPIKKHSQANHHGGFWGQQNIELESTEYQKHAMEKQLGRYDTDPSWCHIAIYRDVCCVASHSAIRDVVSELGTSNRRRLRDAKKAQDGLRRPPRFLEGECHSRKVTTDKTKYVSIDRISQAAAARTTP